MNPYVSAENKVDEGTIREAKEEIGIDINPQDLSFVLTQHRWCPDKDNCHARVGFYFQPEKFIGTPYNAEPEKCDDLQFFPLNNLPTNIIPHVRAVIEAYRLGEKYNEFNWETRT